MAHRSTPSSPRRSVSVEMDGKTYAGSLTTERGMITVSLYDGDSKTTQLGNSADAPEGLARMILRELMCELRD